MRSCSFASVRSTVVVATLAFALSACLGGGGGSSPAQTAAGPTEPPGASPQPPDETPTPTPTPTPTNETPTPPDAPGASPQPSAGNPTAVERAVRRVAAGSDDDTTGWHYSRVDAGSGSSYRAWSQSSGNEGERPGLSVFHAAPWRDEGGEVHFNILMDANKLFQRDPDIYAGRYVATDQDAAGVTVTRSPLDAGSVKPGWRGFRAASTQPGGGTLNVRYFTDATDDDFAALRETYDREGFTRVIALDDPPVPARPADRAYLGVIVPDAGLRGTLDGVAGRFTCAGASCILTADVSTRGYYPDRGDVVFTPDDGSAAVTLTAGVSASVPKVGYLSFGHWLYEPETLTDGDAWDFGVFAGGDDPFDTARLGPLTGRADYAGAAAGVWALGEETIDFSANVALIANFGNASEWGTVSGSVSGFALENDNAAPLSTLTLGSVSFRDGSGAQNIFPADNTEAAPVPGGWVVGNTSGGDGAWSGVWGGQFFGNGASATDRPSAFAGTFGAAHASQGSLAGAFGAHNQPGAEANPAAVERAVRRTIPFDDYRWRDHRRGANVNTNTLRHHYSRIYPQSGSTYRAWSQSSNAVAERPGLSVVHAAPWRDEGGEVQFNIVMEESSWRAYQRDPITYTGRYVATHRDGAGATVTKSPLGADSTKPGWLGFRAASTQPGGGTLNVRYFTDATDDDFSMLRETYDFKKGFTRVIALDSPPVTARSADRGYSYVIVPGGGLRGTLDGVAGRFTCAGASCGLSSDTGDRGYFPRTGDVVFTPDDGSGAVTLTLGRSVIVPKVDYLSFGYWLYAPETLADGDAWDFGLFAGGDDPFNVGNLRALTGTVDYAGAAAGVWATGQETVPFTADVALTAHFGGVSEWGRIGGSVSGFALENGADAPLSTLYLTSAPTSLIYGEGLNRHQTSTVGRGIDNIFPGYRQELSTSRILAIPGGWAEGWATDQEYGELSIHWTGVWGGQFFDNSTLADARLPSRFPSRWHPLAFAGTFGAVHSSQGWSIAGAFGAHRQ